MSAASGSGSPAPAPRRATDPIARPARPRAHGVPAHGVLCRAGAQRPSGPRARGPDKGGLRGLSCAQNRQMRTGFGSEVPPHPVSALAVDAAERQARFEERWKIGGFAFLGTFSDLITNLEAMRLRRSSCGARSARSCAIPPRQAPRRWPGLPAAASPVVPRPLLFGQRGDERRPVRVGRRPMVPLHEVQRGACTRCPTRPSIQAGIRGGKWLSGP